MACRGRVPSAEQRARQSEKMRRGGTYLRYGPYWKLQAALIRERDDFTCQDCSLRRIKPVLPVHHLIPRRHFRGNWEAANDAQNLITLCEACHSSREAVIRQVHAALYPRTPAITVPH
jgi:5-methylcytosine-specific restriction endonuclease McrA